MVRLNITRIFQKQNRVAPSQIPMGIPMRRAIIELAKLIFPVVNNIFSNSKSPFRIRFMASANAVFIRRCLQHNKRKETVIIINQ